MKFWLTVDAKINYKNPYRYDYETFNYVTGIFYLL